MRLHVPVELIGREDLLEQSAELHLSPGSARLYVREHLLEVANAAGQASHLAKALLHRFEPVTDELERFPESLLERALKLLVDHFSHLIELSLVAAAELLKPAVDGLLQVLEARLIRIGERLELHGERLELRGLRLADLSDRLDQGFVTRLVSAGDLLAELARLGRRLLACRAKLLPKKASRFGALLCLGLRP